MTALYLASDSLRRRELLTLLDIPFKLLRVNVIEQRAENETTKKDYVRRLAQDKAQAGVSIAHKMCQCWAPIPLWYWKGRH